VICYSVTTEASFAALPALRGIIFQTTGRYKLPIVLIGCKSDCDSSRIVQKKDAAELAAKWRCPFFETSANLDINVRDAVAALVEEIQLQQKTCIIS